MAIDIHTHVVPAKFPPSVRANVPGWPSMEVAGGCHRNIVIDGKVYRKLSHKCWDMSGRLTDMSAMGVSMQVLSPMPELFSYWMEAAAANDLLRYVNDQTAEFVAGTSPQMVGFGVIPLQDLDKALDELQRIRYELGFLGVEVGSNVNGVPIGSPAFDPFFALAQELNVAIFVHAVRPAGMDRLVGPKMLEQVLAYPTDVGLAAASVICSNLLLRFPRLRIAFSHGGGTLASLLPRLSAGFRAFVPLEESIHEEPHTQARRLFYDSLVYDDATLLHLVKIFGDRQLMAGTDYPFTFQERDAVGRIRRTIHDARVQENLLNGNAKRFLNLAEVPA